MGRSPQAADTCVDSDESPCEPIEMPTGAAEVVQAVHQSDGQLVLAANLLKPKNVCVIGCPCDFPHILRCMDQYLASGSQVHILSPQSMDWRNEVLRRYF